jgi:hypothetical protein
VVEQRPFKSLLTRINTGVFIGFNNLAAHACPQFPTIPYGSIQERCKFGDAILLPWTPDVTKVDGSSVSERRIGFFIFPAVSRLGMKLLLNAIE